MSDPTTSNLERTTKADCLDCEWQWMDNPPVITLMYARKHAATNGHQLHLTTTILQLVDGTTTAADSR